MHRRGTVYRKVRGDEIRRRRNAANMTQAELAQLVGVASQAIVRWESGEQVPRPLSLRRLSLALHCRIDDLIDTSGVEAYQSALAAQKDALADPTPENLARAADTYDSYKAREADDAG